MDIKVVATLLLVGRLISASFIFFVIKRQLALFRLKVDPELKSFRIVLFALSIAIFIGNFIPIIIDILTVMANIPRSQSHPTTIGILYAFSNCVTAILSSTLVWTMYRLANKTATIVEQDTKIALKKKRQTA